jgi:isocitrate dehydrogenase (NAD+)
MAHDVTLIPGDGIGPEVCAAARRAIEATGVEIAWDVQQAGAAALEHSGSALPDATLASIRERGVALKGPVSTPSGSGIRSVNIALRNALDLYAGVRPCRSFEGAPGPFEDVDVVLVRMTGEDLYAGIEFAAGEEATRRVLGLIAEAGHPEPPADTGISLKPISRGAAARLTRRALGYARATGRRRATVIHKATVMRCTDGVFLDAAREVAEREFPDLALDDCLVDTACHRLVRRPGDFDVLVAPVLYGDLLSDLCAGLVGGLGLAPGANLGDDHAVFEAVHGSSPRHAGRDVANPMAVILSGAMLLRHLGEADAADRLEAAVAAVVRDGEQVTYDLRAAGDPRPPCGTAAAGAAVAAAVAVAASS